MLTLKTDEIDISASVYQQVYWLMIPGASPWQYALNHSDITTY